MRLPPRGHGRKMGRILFRLLYGPFTVASFKSDHSYKTGGDQLPGPATRLRDFVAEFQVWTGVVSAGAQRCRGRPCAQKNRRGGRPALNGRRSTWRMQISIFRSAFPESADQISFGELSKWNRLVPARNRPTTMRFLSALQPCIWDNPAIGYTTCRYRLPEYTFQMKELHRKFVSMEVLVSLIQLGRFYISWVGWLA